jgi:hypothetical protein
MKLLADVLVCHFAMLSIAQIIQCQVMRWLEHNELEWMLKEEAMVQFKALS